MASKKKRRLANFAKGLLQGFMIGAEKSERKAERKERSLERKFRRQLAVQAQQAGVQSRQLQREKFDYQKDSDEIDQARSDARELRLLDQFEWTKKRALVNDLKDKQKLVLDQFSTERKEQQKIMKAYGDFKSAPSRLDQGIVNRGPLSGVQQRVSALKKELKGVKDQIANIGEGMRISLDEIRILVNDETKVQSFRESPRTFGIEGFVIPEEGLKILEERAEDEDDDTFATTLELVGGDVVRGRWMKGLDDLHEKKQRIVGEIEDLMSDSNIARELGIEQDHITQIDAAFGQQAPDAQAQPQGDVKQQAQQAIRTLNVPFMRQIFDASIATLRRQNPSQQASDIISDYETRFKAASPEAMGKILGLVMGLEGPPLTRFEEDPISPIGKYDPEAERMIRENIFGETDAEAVLGPTTTQTQAAE